MPHGIFSLCCDMHLPEIETRPPALGVQSLSHWTTREIPFYGILKVLLQFFQHLLLPLRKARSFTSWSFDVNYFCFWQFIKFSLCPQCFTVSQYYIGLFFFMALDTQCVSLIWTLMSFNSIKNLITYLLIYFFQFSLFSLRKSYYLDFIRPKLVFF